jgi:hypothetical protein
MIGIGEIFVERNIRDRPFILLDEFDVGDTDGSLLRLSTCRLHFPFISIFILSLVAESIAASR